MNKRLARIIGLGDRLVARRLIVISLIGGMAILLAWTARSAMSPKVERITHPLTLPTFSDSTRWINSFPINFDTVTAQAILIELWEFSCINCVRTIPYLRTWHEKYADSGLLVVGVHTPEFTSSEPVGVVTDAVERLRVTYPVVVDNEFQVWNMTRNRWWPRLLLLDKDRRIVHDHIGEGGYGNTERAIRIALALD